MMKTKRWLTASQAASELGISTRTLDVLVNQGRIGTLVVPGLITRRFSADDVRTLVEAGTRPATNPAVRRESELVRA
jgi:excisionase family DNA binding protein